MMHQFALRSSWFAALLACMGALSVQLPAKAQTAGWQSTTQPGGFKVARVAGSGIANGMALTCERGVPVLAVNLVTPAPTNPVQLTLDIDQQSYPVTFTRNGRTNVWVAAMRNTSAIDALTAGSRIQVATRGQAIGTLPTAGARQAITTALAGCYRPGPATAANLTPTLPDRSTAAFTGVKAGVGCPSLAAIEQWGRANVPQFNGATAFCGDYTGDGVPDAFAILHYDFIGGNAQGQEAALFHNVGGSLRFLRRVPEFYGQTEAAVFAPGRVTLDMTVMRPEDSRCCPSGKEVRQIDTATGRHSELIDAKPVALVAKTTGPLSALPITLGPYVSMREQCRAPTTVRWFEPGGFWEVRTTERFFAEVAEVSRDGAEYFLQFPSDPDALPADPDVPEMSGVLLRPTGSGRMVMTIQDDETLRLCKPEEIPARFRP